LAQKSLMPQQDQTFQRSLRKRRIYMRVFLKALTVIGLVVGAMSLQACRVSSGVVIGDGGYHGYPGSHRWCGYDRWGRYYCTRYSPVVGLDESSSDGAAYQFTSHDERVAKVSEKYGISHYAATYVVRAALLAENNDLSGLADLGLNKNDLENIYQGKGISQTKMDVMGAKLLMSNTETQLLVDKVAAAARSPNN
jgi:hypothetical protein